MSTYEALTVTVPGTSTLNVAVPGGDSPITVEVAAGPDTEIHFDVAGSGGGTPVLVDSFIFELASGAAVPYVGTAGFTTPWALTVLDVQLSAATAPTGSSLQADLNANGTSIMGTKPTIASGNKVGSAVVPTSPSVASGTTLTWDIDLVGSTVAGAGVFMLVRYVRV
jgi:hypothetical protein